MCCLSLHFKTTTFLYKPYFCVPTSFHSTSKTMTHMTFYLFTHFIISSYKQYFNMNKCVKWRVWRVWFNVMYILFKWSLDAKTELLPDLFPLRLLPVCLMLIVLVSHRRRLQQPENNCFVGKALINPLCTTYTADRQTQQHARNNSGPFRSQPIRYFPPEL